MKSVSSLSFSCFCPAIFASSEPSAPRTILEALQAGSLSEFLKSLSPEELKTQIEETILELSATQIEQLAEAIPLEKIQNAVRLKYPEHINALETARSMYKQAKYALEANYEFSVSLKNRLMSIVDSLLNILEAFLNTFGIADFFRSPENPLEADFKGSKITSLISLFGMLSTLLLPLLGAELAATLIGGTLLSIAALSLLYPSIKPQSTKLPRGENWTIALRQGELKASEARKETLDSIARVLSGGTGQIKKHVMLIGHTGIGKTETAKAFTQAIERGAYKELQGKQVIYFNAANLLGSTEMFTSGNKIFQQINEAMGRHRENYILVIDEIHVISMQNEQGSLSEQLKTLLDPGANKFPYVIGITTKQEYEREILLKNPALARRFETIPIENTDDPETLKILHQAALKKENSKILLSEEDLKYLHQKTKELFPEAAQPAIHIKILGECLKEVSASLRLPLEETRDALQRQLENHLACGAGRLPYGRENPIPGLEKQLEEIEIQLNESKKQLLQLFQDQDHYAALKQSILRRIIDVQTAPADKSLALFLLQSHFQSPLLEQKIRQEAEKLGVRAAIDAELIDEVIAKEQENERKVQKALGKIREESK